MPHIFSWRPKLQVRLKKLSNHIGELGNTLSPTNSSPLRTLLPNQETHLDNDFIVDSAPRVETFSDAEDETSYYYARQQLENSGSYSNTFEDIVNDPASNSNKRSRAVRFCEGKL